MLNNVPGSAVLERPSTGLDLEGSPSCPLENHGYSQMSVFTLHRPRKVFSLARLVSSEEEG